MGIYYEYKDYEEEFLEREILNDSSIRGPKIDQFRAWLTRRQIHPVQMEISFSKGLTEGSLIRVVLSDFERGERRSSVLLFEYLDNSSIVALDELFSYTKKMPALWDAKLEQHCALFLQIYFMWSNRGMPLESADSVEDWSLNGAGTDEKPTSSLHEILEPFVADDPIVYDLPGLPELFFDTFREGLGLLDFRYLPPSPFSAGSNVTADALKLLSSSIATEVLKGLNGELQKEGNEKSTDLSPSENETYFARLRKKLERELVLNHDSAVLNGKTHRLTERQREVVEYFMTQYRLGEIEIRTRTVLEQFASKDSTLEDNWYKQGLQKAFFNDDPEVYRELFKPCGKGIVALNLSKD